MGKRGVNEMGEPTQTIALKKWLATDEKLTTWQEYSENMDILDEEISNLKNKPYLEVSKADIAVIQPTTWTKIHYPIITENTGDGGWGSSKYTVPTDGVYLIFLGVKLVNLVAGVTQYTMIYKNGIASDSLRIEQRQNAGTFDDTMYGTNFVKLNAGDTLEAYVYHTDSVSRNLNYSFLRIIKLT